MNATGVQADPIYMLADDNMEADEFKLYKVPGLGIGTAVSNFAYVSITKNRCANSKFYIWVIETYLVEFVKQIRTIYSLDATSLAWFQLDREPIQLVPFENDSTIKCLSDNHVAVGKPPASTTAITQPCDAGNCFRGPKAKNKKINNKDVSQNKRMTDTLTKVFNDHNTWLNSPERNPPPPVEKKKRTSVRKGKSTVIKPVLRKFNTSHLNLAKLGLLRVQLALDYCMRQQMIRESFIITGIYPFDLDIILSNFTSDISPEDLSTIKENLDILTTTLDMEGEFREADFDELNIASHVERNGKPIDDLVLYRRRGLILTHDKVIMKEKVKRAVRDVLIEDEIEIPAEPVVVTSNKRKATNPEARAAKLQKHYSVDIHVI